MTDDLKKRLRKKRERCHDLSGVTWTEDMDCQEAADRIEELERVLGLADDQCREWRHHCKAAEAKLAQAQTWQPIETAPKDGTEFFAYWPDHLGNGSECVVTTWFGPWATGSSELVFQTRYLWADEINNPTHWTPHLAPPAPPTQDT
jgi:hypothetical protein